MKKVIASAAFLCAASTVFAHPDDPKLRDHQPPFVGPSYRLAIDGPLGGEMRGPGPFVAQGVELMSWITLSDLTTLTGQTQDNANDCWGYTSPSGREYAIIGLSSGTAFVEITNPGNAQYVGYVDGVNSLWRDVQIYQNYAYAVSEGGSGIQVINLANIDGTTNRVSLVNTITEDGNIPTTATHTIIINEQSGYLYRCGGGNNGLRIYSLANPAIPDFVAQWSDRYVHEAHIVTYTSGPNAGKEIAFCCSGFNGGFGQTGLDILDVTNKQNIVNMYPQRVFWPNAGYSHQIWLSADKNYAFLNDELDEQDFGFNTTTTVIDVRFLLDNSFSAPSVVTTIQGPSPAIGHNLYTRGNLIFEGNYRSGLRIYCAENPTSPSEIAFFDTYPDDDAANFNGVWGNFPFFASGTVIASDLERGLFVFDVTSATRTLTIEYPLGHPTFIAPNGSTAIRARVQPAPCGNGEVEPGSVTLHANTGSGFVDVPMQNVGGNEYEALIPASPCGTTAFYYVSAQNTDGALFNNPGDGALSAFSATVAFDEISLSNDNFETDTGWTTSVAGATSGAWQRGIPVNDPAWDYDPATDGDGSGQCWLTQNTLGNTDVDAGTVGLVSPPIDLSQTPAKISYRYFLNLTTVSAGDGLKVEISSAGAAGPWTLVRNFTNDGGLAWQSDEITSAELAGLGVALNSTMRLRFSAADIDPGAIVEAGIDGVIVSALDCEAPCSGPDGDLNFDNVVDARDIGAFTSAAIGGPTAAEVCHGDFNSDETLSEVDVAGLVSLLLAP